MAFKVDIDLLKYLDALETGEEVDGIELDVQNGERKLQFLYDLFIEFNNSAMQVHVHAALSHQMGYQVSWAVQCFGMPGVLECQVFWDVRCFGLSSVFGCPVFF